MPVPAPIFKGFSARQPDWACAGLLTDEQALANDMIMEMEGPMAEQRCISCSRPVQFNHKSLETSRAPQASERTEVVLMETGIE